MADYQAMWKDLGMDLETHDQLCAVLPMAFGDTYLTQENRPENMAFYDFVVSEIHGVRPAELIELQKQGGKVFGMFQALSERYMKNNCACFTPNPGRIEDVVRMAKEYQVDGVIDANLKFCTLYDVEKAPLADALAEEGIPCLGLETDYADNDAEQLRTRIGAFIEMLDA